MSTNLDFDHNSSSALSPAHSTVTLQVSGGKPIRLRAELLAEASSWTPGASLWQELLLYRTDLREYALGLKTCKSSAGYSDIFHARIFKELDQAIAWLQAFDPTADLSVDLDASDRNVSTTDITLRAAALRQRADRVALQYRSMIGELLFRLDLDDSSCHQ